jgi:hypothetical protein
MKDFGLPFLTVWARSGPDFSSRGLKLEVSQVLKGQSENFIGVGGF